MKINFIIPSLGRSGGILVVFKYANLLANRGHDVTVYVPVISYDLKTNSNIFVSKAMQIRRTLGKIYHYVIKHEVQKLCENFDIKAVLKIDNRTIRDADCTIATAWPTAYDIIKLKQDKGEKVYFIQGYEIWDNELAGKKTYSFDMHRIVISEYLNTVLQNELKCKPSTVIHNGIDCSIFYNDNKRFKNKNDHIVCLMLYHHLEKKGVKDGIAAFLEAKKEYQNISLKMFGMDQGDDVPSYVEFYIQPSQKELRKLYSDADIFIYPSHSEGWGLTPTEAMACKCAVVGTNTGCMLDIGIHRTNAMLNNPYEISSMASNIVELCNNQKLLQKISLAGYNTAKTLDWNESAKKIEKELLSL